MHSRRPGKNAGGAFPSYGVRDTMTLWAAWVR
jgi:hypothetical protein